MNISALRWNAQKMFGTCTTEPQVEGILQVKNFGGLPTRPLLEIALQELNEKPLISGQNSLEFSRIFGGGAGFYRIPVYFAIPSGKETYGEEEHQAAHYLAIWENGDQNESHPSLLFFSLHVIVEEGKQKAELEISVPSEAEIVPFATPEILALIKSAFKNAHDKAERAKYEELGKLETSRIHRGMMFNDLEEEIKVVDADVDK